MYMCIVHNVCVYVQHTMRCDCWHVFLVWCSAVDSSRANSVSEHTFVFITIAALQHVMHVDFIVVRFAY